MLPYFILSLFNQAEIATQSPYIQIIFRNKELSFSLIGVAVAIGQVCSIIFPLIVGALADRTGKHRLILLACSVLNFLCLIPMIKSSSVLVSISSYALMFAFHGTLNPLADGIMSAHCVGHPSRYSNMRATGTMGYVVTLIIIALIGFPNPSDNSSILLANLIMSAAFWIAVIALPKETEKRGVSEKKGRLFDFGAFSKSFYVFIFIVGLTRVSQTVVEKLLSSYMTEVLGVGGNFTLFYALSAFAEFIMMIVGGRLLEKKKTTPQTLVAMSCVAMIIRLFILYKFPSVLGLACSQLLHSFTFGAVHISVAAFVNANVDKDHYASAMSFYWGVGVNLPMLLGSLAGGYIIDIFGYPVLFLSYSVFSMIALVLCFTCKKTLYSRI